jgi:acetoacetyl-CoA synthetase
VKLAPGSRLSEDLCRVIRHRLKTEASPHHVPRLILDAPDIPYTSNMKKVESAVTNILNGKPVTNRDALVNPKSLEFFEKIAARLRAG